jgi:hypothetical protein
LEWTKTRDMANAAKWAVEFFSGRDDEGGED